MTAQELFERIPYGHREPLRRPSRESVDRVLRDLVNGANKSGDCIINVGEGYYRPVPGDVVDHKEFTEYVNKELQRARDILLKRKSMLNAFDIIEYASLSSRMKETEVCRTES